MNSIYLHDVVALMEDTIAQRFPVGGKILLRRGQVGTVIEELAAGEAFEVEFAEADGQVYAMLAVKAENLMRLHYAPTELAAG
ncbi:MAG: DUF4926 domain-containing protein [Cyanobacteria bacterium P01_F01_bin.150]